MSETKRIERQPTEEEIEVICETVRKVCRGQRGVVLAFTSEVNGENMKSVGSGYVHDMSKAQIAEVLSRALFQ